MVSGILDDPRRLATTYVVEATDAERHGLWREHSAEAARNNWGSPGAPRIEWMQNSGGWLHEVGTLADMPVAICFTFATIGNGLVMFWEATSRVVDYEMCRAWLEANVPAYAAHHTNATNFGHCLAHVSRTPAESPPTP